MPCASHVSHIEFVWMCAGSSMYGSWHSPMQQTRDPSRSYYHSLPLSLCPSSAIERWQQFIACNVFSVFVCLVAFLPFSFESPERDHAHNFVFIKKEKKKISIFAFAHETSSKLAQMPVARCSLAASAPPCATRKYNSFFSQKYTNIGLVGDCVSINYAISEVNHFMFMITSLCSRGICKHKNRVARLKSTARFCSQCLPMQWQLRPAHEQCNQTHLCIYHLPMCNRNEAIYANRPIRRCRFSSRFLRRWRRHRVLSSLACWLHWDNLWIELYGKWIERVAEVHNG